MSVHADASPATTRPWWRHPAALAGGAVALALVLLVAGLWISQRGEVLPNTTLGGVQVGSMSPAEAAAAIDPVARGRETDEVVFTFEERRFPTVPRDVGYAIDDEASVEAALARGRGNVLTDPFVRLASLWRTAELDLVEVVEDDGLTARIDEIATQVDREPTVGRIEPDPDTLEVDFEPPAGLAEVRREEAVTALATALRLPGPEVLDLPVDVDEPPVDPARAEALRDEVVEVLAAPFALTADDVELTVDPAQLAALLEVVPTDAGDDLQLRVTEEAVEEVLEDAARDRFDVSPVDVRYEVPRTPPTSFSDMSDTRWSPVTASSSIVEGRDGRSFDVADAAEVLTAALRDGQRSAATTLEVTEPAIPNARAQELQPTHLLGTFTTGYTAGQTRVANIQRLADVVDDTQVAPGEQFSINGISGERSCDKGYQPAGTIVRGELVDTCGGGVSQFGTTTYNAAFFSGVQLDQWQAHSFYISRYPEGREATLSFPQLDVRFTNDTDGVIVVRASYTPTTVTVSLYGRPIADVVRAEHGARRDIRQPTVQERTTSSLPRGQRRTIQSTGAPGFTVDVVRVVTYRDGRTDRQSDRTVYRPQNGIVEVGTGPPAPPPEPEPEDDEPDEPDEDDADDD